MTEKDIVTMFNQRMQDGGIKNDRFVLNTSVGKKPQPRQQQSAPKKDAPKDSFPSWKAKNPNGTAAQYKQYLQN
jgi:hypothetical protein